MPQSLALLKRRQMGKGHQDRLPQGQTPCIGERPRVWRSGIFPVTLLSIIACLPSIIGVITHHSSCQQTKIQMLKQNQHYHPQVRVVSHSHDFFFLIVKPAICCQLYSFQNVIQNKTWTTFKRCMPRPEAGITSAGLSTQRDRLHEVTNFTQIPPRTCSHSY